MLKHAFIFSFCLVGAFCAVAIEIAPPSDAEKAQGYACKSSTQELGLMKAGETRNNYLPNSCEEATCSGAGQINYETCGTVGGTNCRIESDLSRPYPDCCPKIVECH